MQQKASAIVQRECAPALEQIAAAASSSSAPPGSHKKGAGVELALKRCFIDCRTLHLTLFVCHIANEQQMQTCEFSAIPPLVHLVEDKVHLLCLCSDCTHSYSYS